MNVGHKLLLLFGYPPLISFVVPVVLYNVQEYNFSNNIWSNGLPAFLMVPQYLVCTSFLLFHLFISFEQRVWSVVLTNLFSSVFGFFAGGSFYLVSVLTHEFKLQSPKNQAYIAGFSLLILIQILGYSLWPFFLQKKAQSQRTIWQPRRSCCSINCISYTFAFFVAVNFICLLTYSAVIISAGIALKYLYFESLSSRGKFLEYFNLVSLYLPILLCSAVLTCQILVALFKKAWIARIIFPFKSLLDFFLGYNFFMLVYNVIKYHIHLIFDKNFDSDHAILNSLHMMCASSFLLFHLSGCSSLLWLRVWWFQLTTVREASVREIPLFNEETQALLPSSGDF